MDFTRHVININLITTFQVLKQLPGKHETIERCTMLPCQQKLYDDLVHQYRRRMNSEADKMDSSSVFMQLRKAANHPLLHRVHFTDEKLTKMAQLISKVEGYKNRIFHILMSLVIYYVNVFDPNARNVQYKKKVYYYINEAKTF